MNRNTLIKTITGVLSITTPLILFRIPCSNFINTLLVEPVFSHFENTVVSNCTVIIATFAAIVWLWGRIDKTWLSLLSVILIFHLIQRNNPYWNFHEMLIFPRIKIWDFILSILFLPIIHLIWPKEKTTTRTEKGFIEDKPLSPSDEDLFKRKMVANEISQMILATETQGSFAIGILGEYGSGKTTFIKQIEQSLKAKAEVIYFNPWTAETAPNVQKDFFDILANHLHKINPRLSSLVLNYSRKLSRLDSSVEKYVYQLGVVSSLYKKSTSADDFDKINELLKSSNKKIVVVIDDLDRLYAEEIVEVLRLIRNTANFRNVFYLVAYEKKYLLEAIKTLNQSVRHNFLDKIIQLEIPLPKRESDDLLNVLQSYLKEFLSTEDMLCFEKRIIPYGFKNSFDFAYKTVFRNSRDVIKFVNAYSLSYRLLKNETLFENLFVLELLKFRFPIVYDMLYDQKDTFLYLSPSRSSFKETYEPVTIKLGEKDEISLVTSLDTNYSNEDRALISSLINNLFNSNLTKEERTRNGIIYPMYFERYFRFRLSSKDISEHSFLAAWDDGERSIKAFIDESIFQNCHKEIAHRLFLIKPNTKDQFELLIQSIFHLGSKFIKKEGAPSFPYRDLLDLIWNYDNMVTNKYYKGDLAAYVEFLTSLFNKAPFPYLFENELIYHIKDESREVGISLSTLVDFQVTYFCEYTNSKGLDKDAMWLFWAIRQNLKIPSSKKDGSYQKSWSFEPSIRPFIRDFIQHKDPLELLATSILVDTYNKNMVSIDKRIIEIFDSPKEFRSVINSHSILNNDIKKEYITFFDLADTKNFNEYVDFEFKTALNRKQQKLEE